MSHIYVLVLDVIHSLSPLSPGAIVVSVTPHTDSHIAHSVSMITDNVAIPTLIHATDVTLVHLFLLIRYGALPDLTCVS